MDTSTTPSTTPPAQLVVAAWQDRAVDTTGYGPSSAYVSRVWLGILGPTATWAWVHVRPVARGRLSPKEGS